MKVVKGHFKSQVQRAYGFVEFFQKFSFLKTDVASWTSVGLQRPHVDMDLEIYKNSKTILGFMPLETCGMFLEVWPPDSQVEEVVFIRHGTIFCMDKRYVHAGGFLSPTGSSAKRIQFCFSDQVLDVGHRQIKAGHEYVHNNHQILNLTEVRDTFMPW